MKNIPLNIIILLSTFIAGAVNAAPADDFVTQWDTTIAGETNNTSIKIPLIGSGYDIDWDNDGTYDEIGVSGAVTHDFGTAGTYIVRIQNTSPRISFLSTSDGRKIIDIQQWGTGTWTSMYTAFQGTWNMVVSATDTPDLSSVTDMYRMFLDARKANPDTSAWDTSNVTNMRGMFFRAFEANPDVSGWDTSKVTTMLRMFREAKKAEVLGTTNWDTSKVTTMYEMFRSAVKAKPDTSNWDTSNVTSMANMFLRAGVAEPDTSGWNTSKVTDMTNMFYLAKLANPNVSLWNTEKVTSMNGMFAFAQKAQPNTTNWDTSKVTNMQLMFSGALVANPDTSSWNTGLVTTMREMFKGTGVANPDTSNWDTSQVTTMFGMFRTARAANPDTSNWNTSQVKNMAQMFYMLNVADVAAPNTTNWDTSKVTDMSYMFANTLSANPDTSNWDTSKVTTMLNMFAAAALANPDTSNWDTSKVTNMQLMFSGALVANPDTSSWNTGLVTTMREMFKGTGVANPDTSNWDTSQVTTMFGMFRTARAANPDTSNWNTSQVKNMAQMFYMLNVADVAAPNTTNWDTSKVTDMSYMFANTLSANPDTSNWDTSKVTTMLNMFAATALANPDTSNWDVSSVTTMQSMFQQSSVANPDVSQWQTTSLQNILRMFYRAASAVPDMSNWDATKLSNVSKVLFGLRLPTSYYDLLLNKWSAQTLKTKVNWKLSFDAGSSQYCRSGAERTSIKSPPSSWSITDGGFDPECDITATINQSASQADPTTIVDSPAKFIVKFNRAIDPNTFIGADIDTSSSTGMTTTGLTIGTITIAQAAPNDGTIFTVSISYTGIGTIIAKLPADKVAEVQIGNLVIFKNKEATSTDNSVTVGNATPSITDASYSLVENSANSTVVGTPSSSDPDTNAPYNTLSYAVTAGNTNSAFAIDSTGKITVADTNELDYETTTSYSLTVTVTDGGTPALTDTATISINITDANDAPTISNATYSVVENSANSTVVGTPSSSDPDTNAPNNTLSYAITAGNTNSAFAIDSTGKITVADTNELDYETTTSYSLTVTVTDGGTPALTDTATISINITDANDAPTISNATYSVVENVANSTVVGTPSSSDPDTNAPNNTLSYAITAGNTNSAFAIDSTGKITVADTSELDYETTTSYSLTVTVTDGGTPALTDTATISINITDANEAPSITNATYSVVENSANSTVVGTPSSSDPDTSAPNNTLSYAITAGNTNSAFAIDSTGKITVADTSELDYETTTSYSLTVTVTDGGTPALTDTATISINITDANDAPTISNATYSVVENSANSTVVGTPSSSDPDTSAPNNTLSYAITAGNTNSAFAIDSTGKITVADTSELDYETTTSYSLTVTVTDGGTPALTDTATISINITNANEAPSITNATYSVVENSANSTVVGTPSSSDPDTSAPNNTLSYAITAGNTNSAFAIDSTGKITVADTSELDYETTTSYSLTVTVTDGGTPALTDTATISINLTDINEAPIISSDGAGTTASKSIVENTTAVTTVSANDEDLPAQTLTYTITGGADNTKFSLNSNTGVLTFASAPDYENPADADSNNSYIVEVTVTDSGTGLLTDVQTLTVTITNGNDAPIISSDGAGTTASKSIAENTTAVTTVSANDEDLPAQTLTYTITGGADNTKFSLNSNTGVLTFASAPDYENPADADSNNSYIVEVTVTDSGTGLLTDVQTLTVTITNGNDAPIISSDGAGTTASKSIAENTTAVTTVSANDEDLPAQTLTYTITGGADNTKFSLNSNTGVLTFASAPDYENPADADSNNSYIVEVTVTDSGTGLLTDVQTLTVTITNANEAPSITNATYSVAENSANSTVVGTPSSSDPDTSAPNNTLSYAITAGNTNSAFAIDSTGKITVADSSELDYETTTSYSLTVTVTDGGTPALTDTATISINITDANEAPSITNATYSLAENSANSTVVGTPSSSDPDISAPNNTLSYAITAGNTNSAFAIDSTGKITVADTSELDYETTTSYSLTVTVTDGGTPALTDTATISINLTDINEAPIISSDGAGTTASKSIAENTTAVTTVSANDEDLPAQTLTYTITGGADNTKFSLNSNTGVLTFASAPDYENPADADSNNSYIVEVTVTDSGTGLLTDVQTLTVTITNGNDAPIISSDGAGTTASKSIVENTTAVTTVTANDEDLPAQVLTYSITGGADGSKFSLNSNTGVLVFSSAPDYENPTDADSNNSYLVEITVTDGGAGLLIDVQTITVTVTNVNDIAPPAPVIDGAPLTNDATPKITGSCSAGDTITLQVDGIVISPTALCPASGTYIIIPSTDFAEGLHSVTATSTNGLGISPASVASNVTIDTIAPIAPVITAPTNGDPVTGTGEAGATVEVETPSGSTCSAVVQTNGTWSCNLTPTPINDEDVWATQTDPAGNQSPQTLEVAGIQFDIIAPAPPVIDPITENTAPITGTAEPGSTLTISPAICSNSPVIADISGRWECDVSSSLPLILDSEISATATDASPNTNVSEPSSMQVSHDDNISPSINPSAGIHISGTGEPGSKLEVTDASGANICTVTVLNTGLWNCTPATPLASGEKISALMTNPNTNKETGPATTVVIEAIAQITLAPIANSTKGDEVTGTAPKESTVNIYNKNGVLICTTTADSVTGEFTCTPLLPVPDNGEQLNVIAIDKDTGTASAPAIVIVDKTTPTPPQINPFTEGDLTITGSAEAGNTVNMTGFTCNNAPVMANQLGLWRCEPSVTPIVGDTITATTTDPAGNESLEAHMPVTAMGSLLPPVVLPSDGKIISGTGEVDALVTIKDPATGETICTATVDEKANWHCSPASAVAIGTTLEASQNLTGETSLAVSFEILDSVIVAPIPPNINTVEENKVTGNGVFPGDMLIIKDKAGKVLCTALADISGNWTCDTNRALILDEEISVIAINLVNGSSSLPRFDTYKIIKAPLDIIIAVGSGYIEWQLLLLLIFIIMAYRTNTYRIKANT